MECLEEFLIIHHIPEWIAMNQIQGVGAVLLGVGMAIFLG